MNIDEVMKMLPHRYPFLMIDKVLECDPDNGLVTAVKNISFNEPCFQGHFPENPVFPGVLIIEAMAQSTGILFLKTVVDMADNLFFMLVGVDKTRFKGQVLPGDVLTLKAKVLRKTKMVWKFSAEAFVGDKLVCSAEIMGAIAERQT